MRLFLGSLLALLLVSVAAQLGSAQVTFLGPTPYLSSADSPFDLSGLGTAYFLEDFEDGQLIVRVGPSHR